MRKGEAVTGLVLLRKGENGRSTVEGVKLEMEALKRRAARGRHITPFYDRTELIEARCGRWRRRWVRRWCWCCWC